MLKIFALACILAVASSLPMTVEEKGVKEAVKCAVCTKTWNLLDHVIKNNRSEEVLTKLAVPLCETIHAVGNCHNKIACKELCEGIINEFAPMMLQIYFENGKTGIRQLCEASDLCPPLPIPPGPVISPGLIIQSNLSDHTGERVWPQFDRPDSPDSFFVHLTDTHLDVFYAEGSFADCGAPICCRSNLGPPPKGHRAAGHFGDYSCDLTPAMFDSIVREMKDKYAATTDFVIITGDEPPHDVWKQSQDINLNAIAAVTKGYMEAFNDVPVFFVLGNHAGFPINTFRPLGNGDEWLYDGVAADWAHWLPADAIRTLKRGGFYQARAKKGLRIISLNTTPLTSDDLILRSTPFPTDILGQLDWLQDVLKQVRELNEKAYIIGHAMPSQFVEPLRTGFYNITFEYKDVIVGYLNGHTHSAELSVMRRAPEEAPFAVAFTAGSVTTETNLNPGFRIWNYTRSTFEFKGWDQYWVDLNKANANPTQNPEWEFRYHAPDHFGMKGITAADWEDFANRLLTDSDLNDKWNVAKFKGGPTPPESAQHNACDIKKNCEGNIH